ncbi:hypothetical protein JCM10213_005930 [Rhodosporidiobolus nylandii]
MFARAARSTFRRQAFSAPRQQARAYSTHPVTPKKSDMPWIVGSLLVFTPLFFSLTSPPDALAHATSPHKKEHAEVIPASTKATQEEAPEEKEPSPSAAAEAEESEPEPEQAEKAAPKQEDKEEQSEETKEEDKEEAKPTGDKVADQEQRKEGTPEAKEGAKQKQPGQQAKVESAIEESKEEETKKDEE